MQEIRLMVDWFCEPTWVRQSKGGILDNISPFELNIPASLAGDLRRWWERHQQTYDASYPPDSGFETDAQWSTFQADGWALARRLREEMPASTVVTYFLPVACKTVVVKLP